MKLTLIGHDDRYAVEQLMMSLFPDSAEGEAVSTLHRGSTWLTATTKININGKIGSATRRIKAAEETVRLRRRALQQSYYLAAAQLLPDRNTLATVWRYLAAVPSGVIEEVPICLCRKIVRWSGVGLSLGQLMTCLDIFSDTGLLQAQHMHKYIAIRLTPGTGKTDLTQSRTMQKLLLLKES